MNEHKNDPTQWAVIKEAGLLRSIGFRILVQEDEFKSGMECKTCDGKGHTDVKCKYCRGTGLYKGRDNGGACPDCEVGTSDGRKSFGFEICQTCKGKSGTIIIPDTAKRRPPTGVILSKGAKVTEFEVGDRVMYTNYTGTDFEIGGRKFRIMLEHDVMCEYKQLKQVRNPLNTEEIKQELEAHGISTS